MSSLTGCISKDQLYCALVGVYNLIRDPFVDIARSNRVQIPLHEILRIETLPLWASRDKIKVSLPQ